jgi:type VI secretion system protein ImpF
LAHRPPIHYQHSLWDRLTIPDLGSGRVAGQSSTSEVERIKDSVRRDLEWLLNSKRPPKPPRRPGEPVEKAEFPEGMAELSRSLMAYGLPDITNLAPGDIDELENFQRTLETVIRDFEPRLSEVKVVFTPLTQDQHRASLHYRIDALLRLDPAPEPIVFDTVLDLGNRAFRVIRD